ncbi:MAG: glycosyl hydrolase, partial [Bacteroidota bacterium]|nr:glycosyl hydrolase [Bacteroidota bacterium]
TESFAAFTHRPTVSQAKWVMDYQLVRGINLVQIMFMPASTQRPRQDTINKATTSSSSSGQRLPSFFATDSFPQVAQYLNRATYLLSQGRPAAQIALYFPTTSMWLGDDQSNDSNLAIVQKLLEKQLDFDFVDEQALSSVLAIDKNTLVNLSNQHYRAVIIPSITAMSRAALEKLKAFAAAGGKVIFMGREPSVITEQTFLKAKGKENLDWAIHEPSGELTQQVLNTLPSADVSFEQSSPAVKYLHRHFKDGELYFFFNESAMKLNNKVTLSGNGTPQCWDAFSGHIESIKGTSAAKGLHSLPLTLEPYETRFIVINSK